MQKELIVLQKNWLVFVRLGYWLRYAAHIQIDISYKSCLDGRLSKAVYDNTKLREILDHHSELRNSNMTTGLGFTRKLDGNFGDIIYDRLFSYLHGLCQQNLF